MGTFLHRAHMEDSRRNPGNCKLGLVLSRGGTECPERAKHPTGYLSEDAEAFGAGVAFFCVAAGCRRSPPRVAAGFTGEEGDSLGLAGLASW